MRFVNLVIPKTHETATADFVLPADLVAKMARYNDSLAKPGVLLALDGLVSRRRHQCAYRRHDD